MLEAGCALKERRTACQVYGYICFHLISSYDFLLILILWNGILAVSIRSVSTLHGSCVVAGWNSTAAACDGLSGRTGVQAALHQAGP